MGMGVKIRGLAPFYFGQIGSASDIVSEMNRLNNLTREATEKRLSDAMSEMRSEYEAAAKPSDESPSK